MVTDCCGEILHVNPAFEAMTGYTSAEVMGLTPAVLRSGRHDHGTYRDLWDTLLAGGVYRGLLVNRRNNGELYRENKVVRPVFDAEGGPTLFLSSGREVATCALERQEPPKDRIAG